MFSAEMASIIANSTATAAVCTAGSPRRQIAAVASAPKRTITDDAAYVVHRYHGPP